MIITRRFVVIRLTIVNPTIFMHNPISFHTSRRFPTIKDKSFFHTHFLISATQHGLISSRGFPIPRRSCPVRPCAVRVLPIPWAEEVPLLLPKHRLSRKFPRVEFVEVDLGDDGDRKRGRLDFSLKVVDDEFFVGRVEAEPWW